MILHTLTQAGTYRFGGKKSPGRLVQDQQLTLEHLTMPELGERLKALWDQGYTLDVHVNAHRDRRPAKVKSWFPANPCRACSKVRMNP